MRGAVEEVEQYVQNRVRMRRLQCLSTPRRRTLQHSAIVAERENI
jgi:hypothetical protein